MKILKNVPKIAEKEEKLAQRALQNTLIAQLSLLTNELWPQTNIPNGRFAQRLFAMKLSPVAKEIMVAMVTDM